NVAPLPAVCWARDQLLLGGEMLCACPLVRGLSGDTPRCEVQKLPKGEPPIVQLQMETSERFLASVHGGGNLRVWWAKEEDCPARSRVRRRPESVGTVLGCCSEVLERHCLAARWAPRKRCRVPGDSVSPALLVSLSTLENGRVTVWRESCLDEACAFLPEARWRASCDCAFSWVAPNWEEEEELNDAPPEDKVPLRATEHGTASASAGTMGSVQLVMLADGGTVLWTLEWNDISAPMKTSQE
ncbi:unnamed protein product, partial [Cladocopium goreaui]